MNNEPIDAVITWVDGYDPHHQLKLRSYLDTLDVHTPVAAAGTRFNQQDEIRFSIHSLLRYAPWLRTIYLVTDNQIPSVFRELQHTPFAKKIQIIDHQIIFADYPECIPTFNSLSIETLIDRIPGLSNQFIYLNDDCICLRKLEPTDFFQNNKIIARGYWKTQAAHQWLKRWFKFKQTYEEFRHVQEQSALLAGWARSFFYQHHLPFSLQKDTIQRFYQQHPKLVQSNSQFRLRDPAQFWPISLAYHLEFQQNNAKVDNRLKAMMINGATHSRAKIEQRLRATEKKKRIAFICIQSLDEAPDSIQSLVIKWLEKQILT